MKKFVINLKRRQDRLKKFFENNPSLVDTHIFEAIDGKNLTLDKLHSMDMDTDRNYIYQFRNRKMTKGEIGCFLSHYKVWQICVDLNEPIIVLEDDAVLINAEKLNESKIKNILKQYGYLNMGRKENYPELIQIINDELEISYYAFDMHAYAITPKAARILINSHIEKNIVPVDEYLPRMSKLINAVAYSQPIFYQYGIQEENSDIEPLSEDCWFIDFETHVITTNTELSKVHQLISSTNKYNISIQNIGLEKQWLNNNISKSKAGFKTNVLKNYLKYLPNHDVILFTDTSDIFSTTDLETIVNKYLAFNTRVLFAAESICRPKLSMADGFPKSPTKYRFLNDRLFMGQVKELKLLLKDSQLDDNSQLYYQSKFLSGRYNIKLDYEGCLLHCCELND